MTKWLLPAALLALSGCGKTDNLDGFKDFKFGLGKAAVEQLGFACPSDGACTTSSLATALEAQGGDQAVAAPASAPIDSGTPDRGKRAFAKCSTCHTINQGGANGIGPNLYGIVGAPVAQGRGGFAFSDALKRKGGSWTFAALDAWLYDPAMQTPGTKMTFAGISDPQERADLIAYLNTQGSNLSVNELASGTSRSASPPRPAQQPPAFTLFGKTAQVTPTLKAGRVVSIDVSIALGQKETVDLLNGEYGSPKSYTYDNISGGRSRVSYWLFGNGASISLVETLAEGELGVSAMMRRQGLDVGDYLRNHTTVRYLDKAETDRLLKQGSGNSVDPNDS